MTRILLVEDEFYFRQALKKYIAEVPEEFCVCGEAENGREGLRLLLEMQPDIALVDITIPLMNGLDMVEQARQAGCTCKILILTGYSEFSYARKAIGLQVQDYLLKPIKSEELLGTLHRIADIIREEQSLAQQAGPGTPPLFGGLLQEHRMELLLHQKPNSALYEELMAEGGFPAHGVNYYLVLLDVLLDETDDWARQDRQLCNYAISNVAGEVLSDKTWFLSCVDANETICTVLHIKDALTDPHAFLEAELLQLLATVQQYVKLKCVITLLPNQISLEQIQEAYPKLQELHICHVLRGRPGLFSGTGSAIGNRAESIFTSTDRRRLSMLLYAGETQAAKGLVREVFSRLERSGIAPDMVYIHTVEMLSVILEYLAEFGLELPVETGHAQVYQSILQKKSLAELQDLVERHLENALAQMHRKNSDNQAELARWITAYLEEQYGNPSLSLERIAGEFFINVQHMCALYKKHTGSTVGNHIQQIRMEHAKEQLAVGGRSVAQVAEACGYSDVGYFGKCFRRYYGLSPRQYIRERQL